MTQHIFLHIPKTAGSSIRTLIQQNYPADRTIGFSGEPGALQWYKRSPQSFKENYRLIHGHFPFGMHEGVTDYTYFTFLRDPVDRHFSDYFFLKRYQEHPMHEALASGRISIEDWARIHETMPMYRDMSTRIVSGDADDRDPDRLSLEYAKYLLSTDFAFVGLAERFDESVLILARRLGWSSVFYLTKNVSANRRPVDPDLRALAATGFTRDLELYEYGRRMFDASPELREPLFPQALQEFKDACRWLSSHLANDLHAIFEVGFELPNLDALVRQHLRTPALDRFLGISSRQAA
jgi:hypothetical protein